MLIAVYAPSLIPSCFFVSSLPLASVFDEIRLITFSLAVYPMPMKLTPAMHVLSPEPCASRPTASHMICVFLSSKVSCHLILLLHYSIA
jgi:hypothetical protein